MGQRGEERGGNEQEGGVKRWNARDLEKRNVKKVLANKINDHQKKYEKVKVRHEVNRTLMVQEWLLNGQFTYLTENKVTFLFSPLCLTLVLCAIVIYI